MNTWSGSIASIVESYISREVPFRFRGIDFTFALSQGLFSSNDIDTGTRLLLRVLSQTWDADIGVGRPLPRSILDAGCGVGVIGICAARALMELQPAAGAEESGAPFFVRAQDRDELARLFTGYNAEKNFLKTEAPIPLTAHTEPLLAFPADHRWDLILTNIPAKAGEPVLEDFVRRSVRLLSPGGRVIMVAVNTLSGFFRSLINRNGSLVREETGREHTVFVYQKRETDTETADTDHTGPVIAGEHFIKNNPFYLRSGANGMDGGEDYKMEGTGYHIDAVHGAAEFDRPCGAAAAAAKLVSRLGPEKLCSPADSPTAILIHECGQGHFPAWLLRRGLMADRLILSGRNILALEAARHNLLAAAEGTVPVQALPSVELPTIPDRCSFIAAFPETVPGTERFTQLWEDLAQMLLPGGTALIALPSSEAEKFDRKKTAGGPNGPHFSRLGDIKRQGFRALAYRRKDGDLR
ncbi:hypothetical protein AGMMS50255_5300 [Spirochaetia bacterium]|nr:hypothetical protein AGMMS50255_5300 [Spirochaetia bacterium]